MLDGDVADKLQAKVGRAPIHPSTQKNNVCKKYATTVDHHYGVIGKQNWPIYQVQAIQISRYDIKTFGIFNLKK